MTFLTKKTQPEQIDVKGIRLRCSICDHPMVCPPKTLILTNSTSLIKMERADSDAQCYICEKCGYFHWFLDEL